jgi:hypothetical protein
MKFMGRCVVETRDLWAQWLLHWWLNVCMTDSRMNNQLPADIPPLSGHVLQELTARVQPCLVDVSTVSPKPFQPAMLKTYWIPYQSEMHIGSTIQ